MKVEYEEGGLEKLCTDQVYLKKKRADIAAALPLRVVALEAAETVGDLIKGDPLGQWHHLSGRLAEHWAGKLKRNWRLIIRPLPDDDDEPWDADTVVVTDIIDYH